MFGRKKFDHPQVAIQATNLEEPPRQFYRESSLEEVDLESIAGHHLKIRILNRSRIQIDIACRAQQRDVITLDLEDWHAIERRILEGLQLVSA